MASSDVERRFRPLGNTFMELELEASIARRSQRRRTTRCHVAMLSKNCERNLSPVSKWSSCSGPYPREQADTSTNTEQVQDPLEDDWANPDTDHEQDEMTLACPQPPNSKAEVCKIERKAEGKKVTTMMIRNLPKVFQTMFLNVLDKSGFKDTYTFAYMPCSFHDGKGQGYAFVDFYSVDLARKMQQSWNNTIRFGDIALSQPLSVVAASIQGFKANVKKWANPKITRIRNPNLRPFIATLRENDTRGPLTECEPCNACFQEAEPTNTCAHEELVVPSFTDEDLEQMLPPLYLPKALQDDQCSAMANDHRGDTPKTSHISFLPKASRYDQFGTEDFGSCLLAQNNAQPLPSVQEDDATHHGLRNVNMYHGPNLFLCTASDGMNGHPPQHQEVASHEGMNYSPQRHVGQQEVVNTARLNERNGSPRPSHLLPNLLTSVGVGQLGIESRVNVFKNVTHEQTKCTMSWSAMSKAAQQEHVPLPSLPLALLRPPPPPPRQHPPPDALAPILFDVCAAGLPALQTQAEIRSEQYNLAEWPDHFERPGLVMQSFPVITEAPMGDWTENDMAWSF